MLKMTSK